MNKELKLASVPKFVLIDTWWNVNSKCFASYSGGSDGFNRYMVECEFRTYLKVGKKKYYSFNRYMVECE